MEQDNLKRKVTLYDPHPGLQGCPTPLPGPMFDIAHELSGQNITLEEAMKRIQPVAETLGGKVEIIHNMGFISFEYSVGPVNNGYRLIRFR